VSPLPLVAILAATPITLQQVRELSRRNTPALLAELTRQNAAEQVRISRAAILPQLSLSADVSRSAASSTRRINFLPTTNPDTGAREFVGIVADTPPLTQRNFNMTVTIQQLLFDGGRWWNQIAQSGAQEEAAAGQFLEQQMTSELEGVRRFYALYGAQRALDVLLSTVQRSKELLDRANALYEAGRLSKSDAIQAQVNLGNDRIAATRQRSVIAGAQSDLAVWIAHPGAEDLVAQDPGTMTGAPAPAPVLENATRSALERRPLMRALANQVRAAEYGAAVAKAGFWPRLSASANYVRSGNTVDPVFTDPSLNNAYSIGLSLRWDLFSGFSTTAQVSQAQYSKFSADLNLADAQRTLEGDLRRNVRGVEIQLETSQIALENRDASAAGLSLAEERYRAGVASTLEVRDAELKRTQAELSLLQARIDLEMAREALARTMGGIPQEGRQ